MKRITARYLMISMLVTAAPAWAINKCVGANGQVTYQETTCPNTSKDSQTVKTWVNDGYGSSGSSRKSVEPNLKIDGPPEAGPLIKIYRRWADAERVAMATSRIALSGPATTLQALQRETEALVVPECMKVAHQKLTELITKSSEAILQFMGKEEVTGMAYQIVRRPELISAFETAITKSQCK